MVMLFLLADPFAKARSRERAMERERIARDRRDQKFGLLSYCLFLLLDHHDITVTRVTGIVINPQTALKIVPPVNG